MSSASEPDSYETGIRPIGDYAMVGDCRSAALVSSAGSVEWLCWPRFDSPSFFASLLDRRKGGSFHVRPVGRFRTERRYVPDTNVLETTFITDGGRLRLLDLMPVTSEERKHRELWPERQLLRRVECLAGRVEVEVLCDPRPDWATCVPRLEDRGPLGFFYRHGAEALALRSEIPVKTESDRPGTRGREVLKAGDRRHVSIVHADGEPVVLPSFAEAADRKIELSIDWWRRWTSRAQYHGPYRDAVTRSALVLKLMTYAPSGAVVAAPTTSLPESIGGVRNWDYRYCWLRDASLTLQALLDLGYHAEANAFLAWLLHSTRMTRPELGVLYDVHGETRLKERELGHLDGYADSRPVRTGNAAQGQLQLDAYGTVVDAAYEYVRRGGRFGRRAQRMLAGLGKSVCERWTEPDEGIWELRAGRRHHTHSKAMCWVALERLVELGKRGFVTGLPLERFRNERDAIRTAIESRGYDDDLGSYVSVFGEHDVDASLLLLARYGYAEPGSERMAGTCRRVRERLGAGDLLYRYRTEDGLPGDEGAFGICSFWAVDCLCRIGEIEEAERVMDRLCSMSNDLGLYAEEIDPRTGAQLGNFPQAFTHVGLIDAALTLQERIRTGGGRKVVETESRKPETEKRL